MAKRGGGSIINMSSWHAYKTITRIAAYAATKGGIAALTRQMALDCGPLNIRVNAVCPGTFDTPMLHNLFANLSDPEEAMEQTYISGDSLMVDGASFVKLARPLMFD